MWYFAWVLGAGFACAFAILNAMWLEIGQPANAGDAGKG
jgi:cyd operon protein YbgT